MQSNKKKLPRIQSPCQRMSKGCTTTSKTRSISSRFKWNHSQFRWFRSSRGLTKGCLYLLVICRIEVKIKAQAELFCLAPFDGVIRPGGIDKSSCRRRMCVCVFISWVFRGLKIMSPENHMKSQHQYPGSPQVINGHSERKTWPFSTGIHYFIDNFRGRTFFFKWSTWLPGNMTTTSPSALSLVELISRENAGPLGMEGPGPLFNLPCWSPLKDDISNKYPLYYIRCIWGWLLRVPSQGYQPFSYESGVKQPNSTPKSWGWKWW